MGVTCPLSFSFVRYQSTNENTAKENFRRGREKRRKEKKQIKNVTTDCASVKLTHWVGFLNVFKIDM